MKTAIILAAGQGTRMKSKLPKVLHKINNRPLLDHVIQSCKRSGIEKNIVIVGHGKEEVIKEFSQENIIFKEQPTHEGAPYGTGYAVMQAIDEVDDNSIVIILCGDAPLIRDKTLEKLMDYHVREGFDATVLSAILEDVKGYGRIIRDENSNKILKIVEEKDATELEKEVKEVNSGVYCFNGKALKLALENIDDDNAQNEYYLTDCISVLNDKNYRTGGYVVKDNLEIIGVNSRSQLAQCDKIIRERINELHMDNGVTIVNPDNTFIDDTVEIGADTIIYSGVTLEGNTSIGEGCIIRGDTRIVNSTIGDKVCIESSLIEDSSIDEESTLGPYAHLRPNCSIGKKVKIGNFVEVKNSNVGDGSKSGHLAYIGDADVGKNVNIGCGVIFVNYDGKKKNRTTVEDNAFIGSNSNLVAPVHIDQWGYVAAGSTITKDVGNGELSIERSKQANIKGWVEKKGLKNK